VVAAQPVSASPGRGYRLDRLTARDDRGEERIDYWGEQGPPPACACFSPGTHRRGERDTRLDDRAASPFPPGSTRARASRNPRCVRAAGRGPPGLPQLRPGQSRALSDAWCASSLRPFRARPGPSKGRASLYGPPRRGILFFAFGRSGALRQPLILKLTTHKRARGLVGGGGAKGPPGEFFNAPVVV